MFGPQRINTKKYLRENLKNFTSKAKARDYRVNIFLELRGKVSQLRSSEPELYTFLQKIISPAKNLAIRTSFFWWEVLFGQK